MESKDLRSGRVRYPPLDFQEGGPSLVFYVGRGYFSINPPINLYKKAVILVGRDIFCTVSNGTFLKSRGLD